MSSPSPSLNPYPSPSPSPNLNPNHSQNLYNTRPTSEEQRVEKCQGISVPSVISVLSVLSVAAWDVPLVHSPVLVSLSISRYIRQPLPLCTSHHLSRVRVGAKASLPLGPSRE